MPLDPAGTAPISLSMNAALSCLPAGNGPLTWTIQLWWTSIATSHITPWELVAKMLLISIHHRGLSLKNWKTAEWVPSTLKRKHGTNGLLGSLQCSGHTIFSSLSAWTLPMQHHTQFSNVCQHHHLTFVCFSFGCSVKKDIAMRKYLRFKYSVGTFAASLFVSCSAMNIFFSTRGELPKWSINDWTSDSSLHRSRFAQLIPINFSPRFSIVAVERGGSVVVIKAMLAAALMMICVTQSHCCSNNGVT